MLILTIALLQCQLLKRTSSYSAIKVVQLSESCFTISDTKILKYTVILTPDVTGGYVVTCPALPGLVTQGDTIEEARERAQEAIELYLESLEIEGEPIPDDIPVISEAITIEAA
jgi:predicted RNase H-like HicB family nuclease